MDVFKTSSEILEDRLLKVIHVVLDAECRMEGRSEGKISVYFGIGVCYAMRMGVAQRDKIVPFVSGYQARDTDNWQICGFPVLVDTTLDDDAIQVRVQL